LLIGGSDCCPYHCFAVDPNNSAQKLLVSKSFVPQFMDPLKMEEEKPAAIIQELRLKHIEDIKQQRELQRLSTFDSNRFLDKKSLTEQDIKGLSARIKRRKHATAEDLTKLGLYTVPTSRRSSTSLARSML